LHLKIVLINGEEAKTSDLAGLLQGDFFHGSRAMTTMLAKGARVVDLERHLERLAEHAQQLLIDKPPRADVLKFEIDSVLAMLGPPLMAKIRIILFADHGRRICRIIEVESLDVDEAGFDTKQVGLRLSSHCDRSWARGGHVKTGFLGERQVAIRQAVASGFDDVLWINGDGELAEATWANIFLIGRTGDLVEIATPPATSGILMGIVRRRITELLMTAKIPVTERVITLDELPRFDEAFVTSSIRGLVPVAQIDRHRLQTLRPNAVFNHISRLYQTWLSSTYSSDFRVLSGKDDA
jgi:branched-chain amino acid aminotransferase